METEELLDAIGVENYERSPSAGGYTNPVGDNKELAEAENTVMFIISTLRISLGMRHN